MSTQEKGVALSQKVAEAADSISNIPHIEDSVAFIQDCLAKLGIYDEEDHEILTSSDCTEGDARCVFCEGEPPVLPVPRFKRVWRILKGADRNSGSNMETLVKLGNMLNGFDADHDHFDPNHFPKRKPVGQWKDEELLLGYSLDTPQDVLDALSKRAHGRAFIIFSDEANSIVDMKSTLHVLRLARRQETPNTYLTDNGVRRLWNVGDFPSVVQTECPLHRGTILFGGYCDSCKKSWSDVKYETMQFARLVADSGEGPDKPKDIKSFMEDLKTESLDSLGSDYPSAYEDMEAMKVDGTPLPNLRKRMSCMPRKGSVADPISPNKRY
jgi:hypothetical protein